MATLLDCPENESWQALLDLNLPPDQLEHFEQHLQCCPACQDRLDRVEGEEEELCRRARSVGDPTATAVDPTLSQFLKRLHEGTVPGCGGPAEPADLYFLRPSDRPDLLGTLGPYEVQGVIGAGGMGVVLKAFEPALRRLVAIKVLAAALAGSATARRRFTREARAAAAVYHDHVVAVHGVCEEDGLPYLVMQYVAGESLQERLDRTGPLEVIDVVHIGMQTAAGLAAAHAQGLIHRDIKPANLLLEIPSPPTPLPSGERGELTRVKITDFGLARMVDDVGLTQNGVVAGTPEYMTPEQARGEPVDHRADLFSLGSVLYTLCAGVSPFRGTTPLAVLRQVCEQEPAPLRSLSPEVPAWLETFIDRLLAKDPAARVQSAAAVAALLEGYLAHLRQPTTVPPPELPPGPVGVQTRKVESPQGTCRSRDVRRSLVLSVFLLLAAVGPLLALLLQAGAQPQLPPLPHEIYQDFRGKQPLVPELTLDGGDADKVAHPEDGGLRITMPATRRNPGPVGAKATFPVAGDFEITGTYELLSADQPARGNGVGIALNVATDPELRNFAKLGRIFRVDKGSVFLVESWNKDRPGNYVVKDPKTKVRTGQLRLVREGPTLSYLVTDGPGSDFRELHRDKEFGTGELTLCRFVVNNSGSPAGVDARLVDLKIRYGQRGVDPGMAAPDIAAPVLPGSRKWLAATGLLVLFLVLAALVGWLAVRRSRRASLAPASPQSPGGLAAAADEPTRAEAAALVAARCSGCGKNLKTRSELAGKKIKCPQCGQAVRLPPVTRARRASEGPRTGPR